jgi:uncharacterized protein HemY
MTTLLRLLARRKRATAPVSPAPLAYYLTAHQAAQARGDFNPWKTSK